MPLTLTEADKQELAAIGLTQSQIASLYNRPLNVAYFKAVLRQEMAKTRPASAMPGTDGVTALLNTALGNLAAISREQAFSNALVATVDAVTRGEAANNNPDIVFGRDATGAVTIVQNTAPPVPPVSSVPPPVITPPTPVINPGVSILANLGYAVDPVLPIDSETSSAGLPTSALLIGGAVLAFMVFNNGR